MISSIGRISFVDVLDAAVSDDPSGGLLHGVRSSTDAVIAIDHHADIALRFDPLGLEVRVGVRHDHQRHRSGPGARKAFDLAVLFEWIRIMTPPASARAPDAGPPLRRGWQSRLRCGR